MLGCMNGCDGVLVLLLVLVLVLCMSGCLGRLSMASMLTHTHSHTRVDCGSGGSGVDGWSLVLVSWFGSA